MKKRKKIIPKVLFTLFFVFVMSVPVWAGNEEKIHLVFGMDAEGNVKTGGAGVALIDLGEYFALTDSSVLSEEAEEYIFKDVTTGKNYSIDYAGSFEGTEIVLFKFQEDVPPENSLVQAAGAKKDQIVNMLYYTRDAELKGCKVRFTEAHAGSEEGVTELNGEMVTELEEGAGIFFLPVIFLDDNGTMFAMASEDGTIFSVTMDTDSFYDDSDRGEEKEDKVETKQESESSAGSMDKGDEDESGGLSDAMTGATIGAIAFLIFFGVTHMRKKGGQ